MRPSRGLSTGGARRRRRGRPKWEERKFPLAGRNRRPPQHFMRRTGHWAGAFATWDWRVHFLTSGPTREMYLPPRMHSSESECGRHFSTGGGDPIGGILRATSLYTVNAGRQITAGPCILFTRGTRRTLINCDQWEASVDCNNYGLTGPLPDHARRSVSFVCVFLHRPSY